MAADAPAPYVARTLAAMILTMSYLRKDFNYLRRINVEISHKM